MPGWMFACIPCSVLRDCISRTRVNDEGKRSVLDHHQEVLLAERKMANTVAVLIPLAMKVVLLQTGTEMERMRLEKIGVRSRGKVGTVISQMLNFINKKITWRASSLQKP